MKVRLGDLEFKNPLILGAGHDREGLIYPQLGNLGFGGVEIGSISPESDFSEYIKQVAKT